MRCSRAYRGGVGESRELAPPTVGPEHVLLALAVDEESEHPAFCGAFGVSHTSSAAQSSVSGGGGGSRTTG